MMKKENYKTENVDEMFDELDLEAAPASPADDFDDPLRDMETAQGTVSEASENARSAARATRGERTARAFGQGSTDRKSHAGERPAEDKAKKVREIGSTDSGRKKEEKPKKKSKIKTIIICALVEILTLGVIFAYGYFLRAWNSVTRPDIDENNIANANLSADKLAQMEKGYFSFVVFGVDGRSASDLVSRGLNSDVIMIVNVNMDTGDIRMCSVFRDTYLNISDKNKYSKINAAYCQGGPEQALKAINKNLDLNITNYVTFNWKAVVDGINILGGVDDIDISKSELYYINAFITETVNVTKVGSVQLTHTGPQHLDGVQAVAYGRLRLMDSDFSRVERQKKIIKACFEKAKKANFSVLNNIIVVCFPQVATNINFNDVVYLAQNISKFELGASGGFPWQRSESFVSSKGDIIVPATLESNVKKLHEFLYDDPDYEVSDAVKRYSETIKEDTHVYKEGQVVESARTDGGLIPKATSAEKSSEDIVPRVEESEEFETDENGEPVTDENGEPVTKKAKTKPNRVKLMPTPDGKYEFPTDEDGNVIYETDADGTVMFFEDENGNIIYPKNADGKEIRPTDADGNEIEEETERSAELDPNAGEQPGDDLTQPGSEMAPGETRAQGPGELPRETYTERSFETSPTRSKETEGPDPNGPGNAAGSGGAVPGEATEINGSGDAPVPGGDVPGGAVPGDNAPGGVSEGPVPEGAMPEGAAAAMEIGPVVDNGGSQGPGM